MCAACVAFLDPHPRNGWPDKAGAVHLSLFALHVQRFVNFGRKQMFVSELTFGNQFWNKVLADFIYFLFFVAAGVIKLGSNLSDILHIYVINCIYKVLFSVLPSSCHKNFVKTTNLI